MAESAYSGKRVAKNTLILYIRMIFMMLLTLYTSRVVFKVLGVEDYGLYDVVGGFVSMFSLLSASLSTSVSRFITFELGRGDIEKLRRVFSTAIIIQLSMAILMAVIIGGVGLWYLANKMNIPDGRLTAAYWVLFCSIGSFGVGLISTPYNACIIAHEKMEAFAFISILDAILKLLIVFFLQLIPIDKLVSYAILMLAVSVFIRGIYSFYCQRHFEECHFKFSWEKSLLKDMGGFAGWSFFGEASWVLNTQGVNLLVNSYFGVTLNAARGIANQVNSAVYRFASNFMTALDPQITKSYASGDLSATRSIVCRGSRLSFFLLLIFAIPICLETPIILKIWLDSPPEHSISFTRLSIICSMLLILSTPLVKAQYATGKIKQYQIVNTLCSLWVFPLTWVAFHFKASPEWSYYIFVIIYFILIFVRVALVVKLIGLSWKEYLRDVLSRCFLTSVVAFIIPLTLLHLMPEGIIRLIAVTMVSVLTTCASVYWLGMGKEERQSVWSFIASRICRLKAKQED